MKKVSMFVMAVLLASPAMASWVRVTNLSGKPQTVIYSTAGFDDVRVVPDNTTSHFHGPEGMLALGDPETIAMAKKAKPGPAGALLGDLVAANRTSRIPAIPGDTFVIWPDGRMLIQSRRALRTMF